MLLVYSTGRRISVRSDKGLKILNPIVEQKRKGHAKGKGFNRGSAL